MAGPIIHPHCGSPLKGICWVVGLALTLVFPSVLAAGIPRDLINDGVESASDQNDLAVNHLEARQNHGTTILFTVSSTATVTVFATPVQPSTVVVTAKASSSADSSTSATSTRPTTTSTSRTSTLATSTVIRSSSSSVSTSRPSTSSTYLFWRNKLFGPPYVNENKLTSLNHFLEELFNFDYFLEKFILNLGYLYKKHFLSLDDFFSNYIDIRFEDCDFSGSANTQRPDSFNLLLLAWRELQLASEADDLSFYQLSRIHGAPFGPWQMPEQGNYNRQVGYCTHHSVIFLPWHRPFLLLLEQTLYRKAREIANRFSGDARTRFLAAADSLRLPYWDWSDPNTQSHIPTIVTAATVSVIQPGPNGAPVGETIPNPLKSYTFQSADSIASFWQNFARWRTTLRQPTNGGVTQEDVADRTLQNGYANRRQSTYLAFSLARFNDFAASIESVHDEVHGAVGGQGHMTYVPYSAYDPIFWLHHCNMDRLMAMYQSAQPNTFLEPANSVPTFANPSSPLDTVDTPLYPFRQRDGSWWTSQNVSTANTIFSMSYGYPEVPCMLSFANFDALRNHTITEINRLYGPRPGAPTKRDVTAYGMRQEWQAKIVIDQAELLGSFTVYLFLGKPPTDPAHWATCPTMIGTLTHLGSPQKRMRSRVIGTNVVLTDTIYENLGPNPTKEDVLKYIRENINWAIVSDGKPVNVPELHTLRVTCISTEVTMPTCPNELPHKGSDTYHLEVTAGKPGGSKSDCDVKSPFQIDGKRVSLPSHIGISE
ncbi:hypothetical protein TWF481_010507 [Arthrobotrys musiformis]|uniref:tyrosinase n=1 Tax=Arthrobotrys musiformis TaxID=47236 RepID=A0AAV9W3C3_9PEZI